MGVCLSAGAQMESSLSFRRYSTQDGLPQMQTERLWQDSRGYIYVGTLSGFARFDGRTFTPFLKGRRFNMVEFAEVDNQVWALDFRRRWRVGSDDAEPQPLDPMHARLLNNFNSSQLPDGYLLLEDEQESDRLLCRLTPQGLRHIVKCPLFDLMTPDRKMLLDSSTLYIPTPRGLFSIRNGKVRRLSAKTDFYTLIRQDSSTLLAFAADGIYEGKSDTPHPPSGTSPNLGAEKGKNGVRSEELGEFSMVSGQSFTDTSYGLIVRRNGANGELVIADEHSLYIYNGQEVHTVASEFNLIKDLLVDRWGRLWVATYQGLYCFFNRGFTNHRLSDPDDIVRAIGVRSEE